MSRAEEKLAEMKRKVDDIQAPDDLGERLTRALDKHPLRRRSPRRWQAQVATLLVFFMLFGYHFNTLAYYGRRFVGYDRIIDGSLQELNALGRGQILDQSYTFEDGRQVTLDGIMLDGNQLLAFCRFTSPEHDLEDDHIQPDPFMRGTVGRYLMRSGAGVLSDDGAEMHYVFHFDPPWPWEKTMVMTFTNRAGAVSETGQIRFVLDRQKAMGFTLRVPVQKNFTVQEGRIRIHSLSASATRTRIRGNFQGIVELAWDTLRGERIRPERLDLQLLVNGEEWPEQGGSMTTDNRGITFEMDYAALPEEILSLKLRLVSFKTDFDVAVQVPLSVGQPPTDARLFEGQDLQIQSVQQDADHTYVTLRTQDALLLSRVRLAVDGEAISLLDTTDESLEKTETGKILRTRTLRFAGTGGNLMLDIQRIAMDTEYGQIISIPLN